MKKLLIGFVSLITVSASAAELTFSRDDRPADGLLKELTIKSVDVRNSSRVKFRTAWVNRMSGVSTEKIDFDLTGMDCFQVGVGEQLDIVNCNRDERPLDGAKIEVIVKRNNHNTFDVVKTTTIISRMTGEQLTETEIMATDLRKK